jgi:hypothetical protein
MLPVDGRYKNSSRKIYAPNPEAVSLDETSQRPFQTVIPLSERLAITPVTTYSVGQEAQLVSEILHSSGVVLICWEHKAITEKIAPGIAGEQKIEGLRLRSIRRLLHGR